MSVDEIKSKVEEWIRAFEHIKDTTECTVEEMDMESKIEGFEALLIWIQRHE